jgi:hypothetical protein
VRKTIRVYTNDPAQKEVQLSVSGSVIKFATIEPQYIRLYGAVGSPIKQSITIIPEASYPFKIIDASAQSGRDIRFELKEEKAPNNVRYVLTVENLKKDAGRYYDTIQLKTDSKVKPNISISVYGRIMQEGRQGVTPQPRRG